MPAASRRSFAARIEDRNRLGAHGADRLGESEQCVEPHRALEVVHADADVRDARDGDGRAHWQKPTGKIFHLPATQCRPGGQSASAEQICTSPAAHVPGALPVPLVASHAMAVPECDLG